MSAIPTVQVVSADTDLGYMIINEADFDPEVHDLYEPPSMPPEGDLDPPPPAGMEQTLTDLRAIATLLEIPGRSSMGRNELIEAIAARDPSLLVPTPDEL